MINQRLSRKHYVLFSVILFLLTHIPVPAQTPYRLYFSSAQLDYERNFFKALQSADCRLSWEVYSQKDNREVKAPRTDLSGYQLLRTAPEQEEPVYLSPGDTSYTISDLQIGTRYGFVIKGTDSQGVTVESETVWITPGVKAVQDADSQSPIQDKGQELLKFIAGKLVPWIISHGDVYDRSNFWGKASFCILQYMLFLGLIFLFISWRELKMKRIFPLEKNRKPSKNVTECYVKNIDKNFDDFSFKDHDIDEKTYEADIDENTMKKFSIFRRWHFLVMKNKYDMNQFITEGPAEAAELSGVHADPADKGLSFAGLQRENIKIWKKNQCSLRVRGIIRDIKEYGFANYPIGRIFIAGLENYEHGGIRWMDSSVEVDRAMENRVDSELIELERNSKMNWLMNIGTIAPMVGLLGTATGISQAFNMMETLPQNTTHQEVTKVLAGGIYSALWTTILGLLLALFFLFSYFYFQHKLDRIHAKWKELYLMISEVL